MDERSDLGDGRIESFVRSHFFGSSGWKTNAGSVPIGIASSRIFLAVDRSCATDFSNCRRSAAESLGVAGFLAGAGAPSSSFGRANAAGADSKSLAAVLRVNRADMVIPPRGFGDRKVPR
jgi:hypothetical protein